MFASHTEYTRLISKTNCSVKLLYDLFTYKEHIDRKGFLDVLLPQEVPQFLRN